jgi:hypothetical protein
VRHTTSSKIAGPKYVLDPQAIRDILRLHTEISALCDLYNIHIDLGFESTKVSRLNASWDEPP